MMNSLQDIHLDRMEYQDRVRKAEMAYRFQADSDHKRNWSQWFSNLVSRSFKLARKATFARQQPA